MSARSQRRVLRRRAEAEDRRVQKADRMWCVSQAAEAAAAAVEEAAHEFDRQRSMTGLPRGSRFVRRMAAAQRAMDAVADELNAIEREAWDEYGKLTDGEGL